MSRSQRVLRNVISLLLTQILTWGITLVVNLYLPQYLGEEVVGQIGVASAFSSIAALLTVLGTENVIVRDVAEDHSRAGDYVVGVLIQRVLASIVVGLGLVVVLFLFHYSLQIQIFTAVVYLGGTLFNYSGAASDVLRGLERIPRTNIAYAVGSVVSAVITLFCIRIRVAPVSLTMFSILGFLVTVGINFASFWGVLPRPGLRHFRLALQIVVAGLPFIANATFVQVYQNSYPFIIHAISGDKAVGGYSFVFRLFGSAMFIPATITSAMLPALTRIRAERPEVLPGVVQRMASLILLGAMPVAAAMIFLARVFIVRVYHGAFLDTIPLFALFGFGLFLWYISIAVGTSLIALQLQNEFGKISAVAAVVAIPLGIGCVQFAERYFHHGAIGASVAQILLEFFILWRMMVALPKGILPFGILFGQLIRTIISALPLILVMYFFSNSIYLVLVLPAGAIYLLLCYFLRCIRQEDIEMLRGTIARKTDKAL